MSASVATREFLSHLQPPLTKDMFLSMLIPPMCLNRYFYRGSGIHALCICNREP